MTADRELQTIRNPKYGDDAHTPRVVRQTPRQRGHLLQRRWNNPGAFKARIAQLVPYVRDRTMLDVGCVSGMNRPDWIHAGLARYTKSILGVDIDAAAVDQARKRGFNIEMADAEKLNLKGRWQVIHAGELIEHLDNPRAFLDAAQRHLAADGIIIITTPNPFGLSNFVYRLGGKPRVNGDHVAWYCEDTLRQLLERNNYEILELKYLRHAVPWSPRSQLTTLVRRVLPKRLAWNTLMAVARPTRAREFASWPGQS